MSEEELKKVNINDFKIEELTLEEQEAFDYFNKSSEEVTFTTNIDGDKFLEALGIKKEDNFGELQYKISTLLNLIVKQQKEIENYKKDYNSLLHKIENKIDNFDYAFEKAKKRGDSERADFYWDLIINFKKLLEE